MYIGEKKIERPFRWGIVGGGRTSNVGYKHRGGALRDNTAFQMVCGAFDIDEARGREFGVNLGVDPARCYPDYKTIFTEEAKREDGVEVVDVAVPNGMHYEVVKAALEANLHVICEKPLFFEVEQGEEIKRLCQEKKRVVAVCYTFSGYPILTQLREMIKRGDLGEINMVDMTYAHGFGCDPTADKVAEGQKWRVNPKIAGPSFVLGDLSTHTFYISEYLCPQLKVKQVLCDRQAFVGSRYPLEDNAYALIRYESGAVGRMWASAVNAGCLDGNRIRIVGSKASVEWCDREPDFATYEVQGEPQRRLYRSMGYLYPEALEYERLGSLHAEGLIASWSNLYLKFAIAMDAMNRGDQETLDKLVYPDIDAGIEGIRWIQSCVKSADNGGVWVDYQ